MKYKELLISASLVGLVAACGGGSASGPGKQTTQLVPATVAVSGSVSALNGEVAFYSPSVTDTLLAGLFGKPAFSAITGETSVGAGVTVNLIEVDVNGATVGDVVATATTDADGNYSLEAPEGFTADSKYVVRAVGTSVNSDARVTTLAQDIDTTSDAASSVISTAAMDLGKLSTSEIEEIHAAVADIVENTDSGATTIANYRSAIVTAVSEDEAANNLVASTVAAGQICGTVKDSAGAALSNIRIVVRDFGNWVTRAKAKTDSAGAYCVNVPKAGDADTYISGKTHTGEYILGALNFTGTSFAATQWWTSTSSTTDGTGGANTQFKAEKISVAANATTITKDMFLDKDGARVTGTVTGPSGASVEGMRVVIRNYDTFKPLASARIKADGTYRINVKATDYMMSFRNKTRHPYASEVYRSGTDGVNNQNMASRESMTANQDNTYDAVLDAGVVISGIVEDNANTPVSGEVVYVNNADGGKITALRTNKSGKFRLWVNPRLGLTNNGGVPYIVSTRGQVQGADTNGSGNIATSFKLSNGSGLTFTATTTKISGRLMSADGTPVPVSSAIVFLSGTFKTKGISAADGTFSMYVDNAIGGAGHKLYVRVDNDLNYGSGVYNGTAVVASSQAAGTSVVANAGDNDLGDITMPTLNAGNSVGYVKGNAGAGSTNVTFRKGGTGNGFDMVTTKTRGDGSFIVTVPAVNYENIRIKSATGASCINVTVNTGATVTLTDNVDTTCTITP